MARTRPNGHVPSAVCVDDVVEVDLVAERYSIGTLRFVVLFWKVKCVAHTETRGLNCIYVIIIIVLFVLGAAAAVTMCGGFVYEHQISPLLSPFFF